MTSGPKPPGVRTAAKDRQAALYGLLAKDPTTAFTRKELHERLWRVATRTEVNSALYTLRCQGLVTMVFRAQARGESTFQVVAP